MDLPEEIQLEIFKKLSLKELVRVCDDLPVCSDHYHYLFEKASRTKIDHDKLNNFRKVRRRILDRDFTSSGKILQDYLEIGSLVQEPQDYLMNFNENNTWFGWKNCENVPKFLDKYHAKFCRLHRWAASKEREENTDIQRHRVLERNPFYKRDNTMGFVRDHVNREKRRAKRN